MSNNGKKSSTAFRSDSLNAIASQVLLQPKDCVLLLIDYEPQMIFPVKSMDIQLLKNNVLGLIEACTIFKVPTILTTVDANTFSGPILKEINDALPDVKPIDRTIINAWQDSRVVSAVKSTGRKKIIMGGLWTEVCLCLPTLCALKEGFDVYIVVDAVGGSSEAAHKYGIDRMVNAGAIPVTWQQIMLEFQADWARTETAEKVLNLAKKYSGAYGVGIEYSEFVFPKK